MTDSKTKRAHEVNPQGVRGPSVYEAQPAFRPNVRLEAAHKTAAGELPPETQARLKHQEQQALLQRLVEFLKTL